MQINPNCQSILRCPSNQLFSNELSGRAVNYFNYRY